MPSIRIAVDRLEDQLPLRVRQQGLPEALVAAHRAILRSFAATGRPPALDRIEQCSGMDASTVIDHLSSDDLIVAREGRIEGAYPFSLEPTPHVLSIGGFEVYAMCALDAVAVAPVFGLEVVTTSRCAVTGAPIRIHQVAEEVDTSEPDGLRVGVRWQRPDGCAAHSMCREMVFLSDLETAEQWRGAEPDGAGIFDLSEAVEFGVGFFAPLIGEGAR
jgi:mercuric reductase